MNSSLLEKQNQLSMSFGKANAMLNKLILFSLVQEAGENSCYRCGFLIDSAADITIEHKQPWLYADVTLFFGLDNIAFSYPACNVSHVRKPHELPFPKPKPISLSTSKGAAWHQLRRSILFAYVQKLGRDNCFHCKNKIPFLKEFSIEHKSPWLHADISLFWDLNNISFSHFSCNMKAARMTDRRIESQKRSGQLMKERYGKDSIDGKLLWCRKCTEMLAPENFTLNKAKVDGRQDECRTCRSKYRKELRVDKENRNRSLSTEHPSSKMAPGL